MGGLMTGTGLLGRHPAGSYNAELHVPDHLLYLEPSPKRIRIVFAGETIADSRKAKLLFETAHLPVYYLPREDVRQDLLEPTDRSSHCPVKGDASYWSVVVGDRRAENAVWGYPAPLTSSSWLLGHQAFYWQKMEAWYEEEEQVFVHPRDPYCRLEVLDSSRQVRVLVRDQVVAESQRPKLLFESGLPVRYYLPREDVRMDLLTPTETSTKCPYKGTASYWSVQDGDGVVKDPVWTYTDPLREVAPVRDLLCFYSEHEGVDVEVDGEIVSDPYSPFIRR
jgi:uncharacterized protein (DUF427 family)